MMHAVYISGIIPLNLAISRGCKETALALLAQCTDVNSADIHGIPSCSNLELPGSGFTALHEACLKGDTQFVLALIAAGADVYKVGNGISLSRRHMKPSL